MPDIAVIVDAMVTEKTVRTRGMITTVVARRVVETTTTEKTVKMAMITVASTLRVVVTEGVMVGKVMTKTGTTDGVVPRAVAVKDEVVMVGKVVRRSSRYLR